MIVEIELAAVALCVAVKNLLIAINLSSIS
jgi:hypothetical protein